ncbi:MAG TPA: translocation/assembly module TamB domain-containing protein [Methylocella sp.]|nr:translocation/assembly module TamB domain-containing protein [Methylocella sp.]
MARSHFFRTLKIGLTTAGLILIGFILLVMVAFATDLGREIVAKQVSRAISSPTNQISIGRIEGQLASDFSIHEISFADQRGVWLNIDDVHILWKPLALLWLRLYIDTLDVNQAEVHRKPVSETHETRPGYEEALSPRRLPVSIEVKHFSVANLATDASILGMLARFSAAGAAHLTTQGLGLMLDADRLDRQGTLAAQLDFVSDRQVLRTSLHLDEPAGGILAQLADFPDRPPVALAMDGDGTLDAYRAQFALRAGPTIDSDGTLTLDRAGMIRNLSLELSAHLPSFSFDRVRAKAKIAPSEAVDVFDLETEAETTGLKFHKEALNGAIGPEIHLTMQGVGQLTGQLQAKSLKITAPALSVHFTGEAGTESVKGHIEAELPDLAKFAKLAGIPLRGEAQIGADLEGMPSAHSLTATLDATARRLATGVPQIDGLTSGDTRLTGGVSFDPATGIRFGDLSLAMAQANARLDGAANQKMADVTARLTLPSMEKIDKRLAGHGEMLCHVTGTLDHPDAALSAEIRDGALLGRAVPQLILKARGTDLLGPFDAEATLDGSIGGKPAQGSLHFARVADNEIRLDPFNVKIGAVTANGAVTVDRDWLASGKLTFHGQNLDDLSPFVLEKLTGAIDADLTFSGDESRQNVTLLAKGEKLAGFGMGLEKLSADLSATDLYQRSSLTGSVEAAEARIGSQTITRLRLDVKGVASGATDVNLTALTQGVDIEASGRVDSPSPIRLDLSKLDARRGGTRIGLARPATITHENGQIAIRNLVLLMYGGRLSVDGQIGPNSDLKVKAVGVPLSVTGLVAPELGLGGTLDGEVAMAGPASGPSGTYRLRIANALTTQSQNAGLPPVSAEASGSLESTRTRLTATITAGDVLHATVAGTAPIAPEGSLDLTLKGTLDAGIANRAMTLRGRRVTGTVAVDGRVTGLLNEPSATGTILFSNGSYQDADLGTRFDTIHAKLVAQGDKIMIENASAVPHNGGALTLSGAVRLDPAGGFPGSIKIMGQRAEIVSNAMATAIVDLDLAITGPLRQDPRIGGKVGIETLDISIAEQVPSSTRPLAGIRHIRPPPMAQRRLALAAKDKTLQSRNPFTATLDVMIDVPGRVRVTGRGLDAELGGKLKVNGTLAQPQPEGAFHLLQGKMQILTTQLDFTRANLTFAGDLSPQLDFLGTTQAGGASIRIAVTGKPSDPHFEFSSSPDYPEDEILSRLLFGQPAGNLTVTQALALTQAVAIYSGGNSALEGLRRSLGLGDASGSSDPLSEWFGNRASLGVRTGATPAQTGLGVDISIWRQLKARGAIDAKGAASVGVGAETEW